MANFERGARVRVTNPQLKSFDQQGEVTWGASWSESVNVRLDGGRVLTINQKNLERVSMTTAAPSFPVKVSGEAKPEAKIQTYVFLFFGSDNPKLTPEKVLSDINSGDASVSVGYSVQDAIRRLEEATDEPFSDMYESWDTTIVMLPSGEFKKIQHSGYSVVDL